MKEVLLAAKRLFLRVKDRLYAACVRMAVLCGSEIWALNAEDKQRVEGDEAGIP